MVLIDASFYLCVYLYVKFFIRKKKGLFEPKNMREENTKDAYRLIEEIVNVTAMRHEKVKGHLIQSSD